LTRTAALNLAVIASNRLQPIVAAVLCLMAAQLAAAAFTPEPVTPYAARVAVVR
jgi:hypothetical protein